MGVWVTGDTHAEFNRFSVKNFPEQKNMTRNDIVIVLGDFGGIWGDSDEERYWLKWLAKKPFTLCFVDGNHENYDRLYGGEFPVVDFHGGKAHKIRKNIYHLMRGNVFDFEGKKFFAFGGASSHDIQDGILDRADFETDDDFERAKWWWFCSGKMFRVNHASWWKEELPSQEEMDFGKATLEANNWEVDYVLSHCLPRDVNAALGFFNPDSLNLYFEELVQSGLKFQSWWSGHLHRNEFGVFGKYNVLYEKIVRLL